MRTRTFHLGRVVAPRRATGTAARADVPAPERVDVARLDDLVGLTCEQFRRYGRAHHPAVEGVEDALTYAALDAAANRLARFLRGRRIGAGDRVGVLLDRATEDLTAHLAVARIGAVRIPLDPTLPDPALAGVLAASGVGVVLTTAGRAARLDASDVDAIYLDRVRRHVDGEDPSALSATERGRIDDAPAYVVVHADGPENGDGPAPDLRAPAVGHHAVTNLVRVVAGLVDLGPDDRVFHDPRRASDLAILETWLPWSCGATVVVPATGADLRGAALGEFLRERRVTVLRADAGMLDGVEADLPDLRLLLLSGGEAAPEAWHRAGRRILGLQGPPETTVAAFWAEQRPGRAPTLGRPLPTYDVVVLDPRDPSRALPAGETGEVGVTGPGLADGYVGAPGLTREAFADGPGGTRVFRTGDLGRVLPGGEVERLGRVEDAGGRGERHRPVRAVGPTSAPPTGERRRTTVMTFPGESPAPPSSPASSPVSSPAGAPDAGEPSGTVSGKPETAPDGPDPSGGAPDPSGGAPDSAARGGDGGPAPRVSAPGDGDGSTVAISSRPAPAPGPDAATVAVSAVPSAPPRPGAPGTGRPGDGRPGDGRPGDGRPGDGRPGDGRPGGPATRPGPGGPDPSPGAPGTGGPGGPGGPRPGPGAGRPAPGGPGGGAPGSGGPGSGGPGRRPGPDAPPRPPSALAPPMQPPTALAPSAPPRPPGTPRPAPGAPGRPGPSSWASPSAPPAPPGAPPRPGPSRPAPGQPRPGSPGSSAPPWPATPPPGIPAPTKQPPDKKPPDKQPPGAKPEKATPTAEPAGDTQARLGAILAEILGRSEVPASAHFFDDLGADSLLMARFCARVRKDSSLPSVGMPEIYRTPTLAGLASALAPEAGPGGDAPAESAPASAAAPAGGDRATSLAVALCGAAQLAIFLGYSWLTALFLSWGFEGVMAAPTALDVYLRALAAGAAAFVVLSLLPIVAKWVLIGRWKPGSVRVWSLGYLRFWIVKSLVRTSPLAMFAGTPLQAFYLRALGARVGRGAVLLNRQIPVCTDLFSVGENTLVRKDAVISCYRPHDGRIEFGGVSLGANVFVGESTVLDIGTAMGDGSSLAHSSSLHSGQAVPAGETWHGSPGRRSTMALPTVPPAGGATTRRVLYSLALVASLLLVGLPASLAVAAALITVAPQIEALFAPAPGTLLTGTFYLETLALTGVLYLGGLALGLISAMVVPRLLFLGLSADRVYPLYGVRYWLHTTIGAMTNVKAYAYLFGDSSAIAHWLSRLGYRLRPLVQTGSNFGMAVKHENPFLTAVGSGTVVADGLSVMNAEYSPTSFRVATTTIGANNFLGNRIAYPPQGRTGDDCLLATKVAVPMHGAVRHGVGLLGSPSFEIPRTVARDSDLDVTDPAELAASLRLKNRHNGLSMVLHVLVRWIATFLAAVIVASVATLPIRAGALEIVIAEVAMLVVLALWFVLVERVLSPLKARVPQGCSIYDKAFWRHERYWKIPFPDWPQVVNGTPFKPLVWRLLGVHIGKRVFDDGLNLTEKTFTTIGDDCTFGEGVVVQCHSQEDGGFKSDDVVIGDRCTFGVGAFVHYGTTVGEGAVLAPDTFLMKGEEVPPGETWGGNPAGRTTPVASGAGPRPTPDPGGPT